MITSDDLEPDGFGSIRFGSVRGFLIYRLIWLVGWFRLESLVAYGTILVRYRPLKSKILLTRDRKSVV